MQLARWASSVGLVLSLGCSSGGGSIAVDSGVTPTNDLPRATDTPAAGDGGRCAATACGACTPMAGCGWCARPNPGVTGTSTGSPAMSCTGADWDYLPSDCAGFDAGPRPDVPPVVCSTSTTCGACTPRGGCGWCATTNSCVPGSSTGATAGNCTGAAWQYLPSQCPGFDGGPPACTGVPRTCNLTIAGGVRTCTAGAMVTVGCNSGCTPALGTCTGDPVMQICPGTATTAPCAAAAVIASNDDAPASAMCGGGDGGDTSVCPLTTFVCPSNGMYTVWVGPYDDEPATCVPAVR